MENKPFLVSVTFSEVAPSGMQWLMVTAKDGTGEPIQLYISDSDKAALEIFKTK